MMLNEKTKQARAGALCGVLISLAIVALSGTANAEESVAPASEAMSAPPAAESDPIAQRTINDDDPESSVYSPQEAMRNPLNMGYLLMALADRADRAAQNGDHAKEAKYYRAIVKAVPERSVGYRRACAAHDTAHEWEKALQMCRGALGTGGVTLDDHLAFLKVLLKKPGRLNETETADADVVVERFETELKLGKDDAGRKLIAEAKCQIAAKLEDSTRLSVCTKALRDLKVEPAKLYAYEWALALSEGDKSGAREVIETAKNSGLPAAAIAAMERGLSKADEVPTKLVLRAMLRRWWPALGGVALALLALLAVLKGRRARPQAV